MTPSPRFAFSNAAQSGERRTVRHVIGALRQSADGTASTVGAAGGMIRRDGNNYTF